MADLNSLEEKKCEVSSYSFLLGKTDLTVIRVKRGG